MYIHTYMYCMYVCMYTGSAPTCSMCDTSKRESELLVWRWEATMLSLYCTGILHPAKGTILPPCDTWRSYRAVLLSWTQ